MADPFHQRSCPQLEAAWVEVAVQFQSFVRALDSVPVTLRRAEHYSALEVIPVSHLVQSVRAEHLEGLLAAVVMDQAFISPPA